MSWSYSGDPKSSERDELRFKRKNENNHDLALYGSRGEQRMAVLALKFLELRFIESYLVTQYKAIFELELGKQYWIKIKRDESVGINGTLYCYIYDEVGMSIPIGTLTLTLKTKEDYS